MLTSVQEPEGSSCEYLLLLYYHTAPVMGRGAVMQEKPAIHVSNVGRNEPTTVHDCGLPFGG
jgi:hypothetical protein